MSQIFVDSRAFAYSTEPKAYEGPIFHSSTVQELPDRPTPWAVVHHVLHEET